jgi:lipoprotein-releasing system ATP-binding protein
MIILSAKNIRKTFRHPEPLELLSNISLDLHAGESIAITGRSGEGKTTLLHILGTLEPFDSGELTIVGQSSTPTLRNRHLGFIFQSYNLLEDFTALENVLLPARIARQNPSTQHGLSLLSSVGLLSRAHHPAKLLSGGERQRVAIARALCNNPDILFADEPSGNLDRPNADAIGTLLFDLVRQKNKSLILVTHDETLAKQCDRRLHLSSGTLTVN